MFRTLAACTACGAIPLAVLVLVTTAGTAAADPANNACPAGYETITVKQATKEGYITAPSQVDSNGDGIVCRRALGGPPGSTQVYFWEDNSAPRNL